MTSGGSGQLPGEYVDLTNAATLGATITGFTTGGAIDFEAVDYASTDTVNYQSGVVSVVASGVTVASFDVSGTYTAANFVPGNDGTGHLQVTYADPPAHAVANAAQSETDTGSLAELLGGYYARTADPPSTPSSVASAFDSWAALASSAGTDPGCFGSRYENNGNAGGARDAWGVSAGWTESIGHGPAPGS
jgi:hypothetical protein